MDVAQFGVEIPPVKGAEAAAAAFGLIKGAAAEAERQFAKMSRQMQTAGGGAFAQQANNAKNAATQITGVGRAAFATGTLIRKLVIDLVALAAAVFTVKKAFDLFSSAISEAGKKQAAITTFRLMIDNAGQAAKAISQLAQVQRNVKFFDDQELLRAATVLKTAGVATQNLGNYTQGLAVLAGKARVSVEQMAQAWVQAIKGRVTSSTFEVNVIMEQLGKTTGKTMKELREGLQSGSIGAKAFTSALIDASRRTDALSERQKDYVTQVRILGIAWNNTKEQFGKPIVEALSPLLQELTKSMNGLPSAAESFGTAMATVITKTIDGLKELIEWIAKAQSIMASPAEAITRMRDETPTGLAAAPEDTALARQIHAMRERQAGRALPHEMAPPGAIIQPAKDATEALGGTNQALDDLMERTGRAHDVTKDFAGDLKVLIDYWEDYNNAMKFSTSETSRNWHTQEALQKAITSLGDPMRDVQRLMPGLSPDQRQIAQWLAWNEAAERSIAQTGLRMKAGMASMSESVGHGLTQMSRQWGTWQEQVSRSVGDIGNAISSGITNGLSDILEGTKSVKDGFRAMALAIVQDIERIIIKMLVQLAIQQLISAFGGGGGAAGGSYLGVAGLTQAGGEQQQGGRIPGTGSGDHVPILGEPGEFMINKKSALAIGYGNLERMNKMQGGGRVQHLIEGGKAGGTGTYYWPGGGGIEGPNAFSTGDRYTGGHDPRYFRLENPNAPWVALALGPNSPYHYGQYVRLSNGRLGRFVDYGPGVANFDVVSRGYYKGGPRITIVGAGRGGMRLGPDRHRFGPSGFRTTRFDDDISKARRLGFGGRGDFRMDFPEFSPRGTDLGGGIGRYDRPGFSGGDRVGPGQIYIGGVPQIGPGGTNEYVLPNGATFERVGPNAYAQTSGPDMGITDQSLPAGAVPLTGGRRVGAREGRMEPFTGGRMWTGAGWSTRGSFGVGGEGGSFFTQSGRGISIPGGINWSPGSPGGNLGNWGDKIAWSQFRNMMRSGIPSQISPAMRGFAERQGARGQLGWTPQLIRHYRQHGFPGNLGLAGGERSGIGPGGAGRPMTKAYHAGGIVGIDGSWAHMQGGGEVISTKKGEGVFTPAQMRAMAPAQSSNVTNAQVNINITNSGGKTDTDVSGDINDADGRDMARQINAIVIANIEKQKRSGGGLYLSRSQRGG